MEQFSFPYTPYSIQVDLMRSLWNCIENRHVGVFESPTGTGKSLSLICAALSWLEKFEESEAIRLQKMIDDAERLDDGSDDWIAAYRQKYNVKKKLGDAVEKLEMIKKVNEKLKNLRVSCGTKRSMPLDGNDEGQEDSDDDNIPMNLGYEDEDEDKDIAPCKDYSSDVEPEIIEEQPSCCKIFYTSRTHSQLEQFSSEVSNTRFRPRIVTLGSRDKLCVNLSVRNLKKVNLMNEKCLELRQVKDSSKKAKTNTGSAKRTKSAEVCEFFKKNRMNNLSNQILISQLSTMEKVVDAAKEMTACPYFASRDSIACCQLVLLPYQILFHKTAREAWGIDLKDNIIIIDEAHNLLKTISSVYCVNLPGTALIDALSLIREYHERYKNRLLDKNLFYIRQITLALSSLAKILKRYDTNKEGKVFKISSLLLEMLTKTDMRKSFIGKHFEKIRQLLYLNLIIEIMNLHNVDFFKILRYMEKSQLCRKLNGFYIRYKKTGSLESSTSAPKKLTGIERLLRKRAESSKKEELKQESDDKKEIPEQSSSPAYLIRDFFECLTTKSSDARIIIYPSMPDSSSKYKFILLNPAEKLAELINCARSTILIGGTMEPADHLLHSLTNLCKVESKLIARFSCGHIINSNQLTAISIPKDNAGNTIVYNFGNRNSATPLNAIAMVILKLARCVPNGVVAFFPSYDYMTTFEEKLKCHQPLLKRIKEFKEIFFERKASLSIWDEYVKEANSRGAILCAVVGGKLSEGINFSDGLGRCVLMIGLPYGNRNDLELKERLKYCEETMGSAASNELYEADCLHVVNQAIGRAIRHQNDYAVILLLDARYSDRNISKKLPKWILQRLKPSSTFDETFKSVEKFFESKKITNN